MTPADFGVCIYSRGREPGTLTARWIKPGLTAPGTGVATGGPAEGFAGSYEIIYTGPDGSKSEPFSLTIRHEADCYQLEWHQEAKLHSIGIGFIQDGALVLGYRKLAGVMAG